MYSDDSDVDVETLENAVNSLDVTDAIQIYRCLSSKNVPIPDELWQNMFELICFYNHQDQPSLDLYESRGQKDSLKRSRDYKPEIWTDDCLADQMFERLEPKTDRAYNTMIRAMLKYQKRAKAEELFKEASEKKMPIDLSTYNMYIKHINDASMTAESRWEQIKLVLQQMKARKIQPDVHTLNAVLIAIKTGGYISSIQDNASKAMAEFKALNIEPCLETYSLLLDIFHGKNTPENNTLSRIVEQLEKNVDLKAQSVDDVHFFYKAMTVCRYRLANASALARRIDNIVTHKDNINFLGDSQLEQRYYRYFLSTILQNEKLPEFIEIYDTLVPSSYALEPPMVEDILSTINLTGAIHYIPKFWTDMIICGISKRTQLAESVLSLIASNEPKADVKEHAGLGQQFADIAWTIYQNWVADQYAKGKKDEVTPAIRFSRMVEILLRAQRHNEAKSIITHFIDKKSLKIVGQLSDKAMSAFIDSCVANNDASIAVKCIGYAIENGIGDPTAYGRKVVNAFTLQPHDLRRLVDFLGADILKAEEASS